MLSHTRTCRPSSQDAPQQIDINPGKALERLDSWVDGAVRLTSNIVTAVILFIVVWFLAKLFNKLVSKQFVRAGGRTANAATSPTSTPA